MPKSSSRSIPLLCNLCPKHPRFSDVSHLLTHISSKSHLSNRFKLQIRSQSEPQARRQLEDFDNWYAEYGLEDLLSERLSAKEHKKAVIKQPRVSSILPKVEFKQHEQSRATSIYRPPVPQMHTWSTGAELNPTPLPNSSWNQDAMYATPTMQRMIPNFTQSETPLIGLTDPQHPSPMKPDGVEEESDIDTSKLKGVLWPGMDLFDSATAEMKRMRNQRKDRSVLEQMKMNSADVEPTELVFDSNGDLRKARHIFDDATDSGPEEIEAAPTPKKRRIRKSLLAEISTNIPRRRPNNADGVNKPVAKRKAQDTTTDAASKKRPVNHNSRKVQRSFLYAPTTEEDEEFRLTMESLTEDNKFGVFRDEDNSPGRTESPLEEHRFDFSNNPATKPTSITQHSPSPLFKPLRMHFTGKENIRPEHLTHRIRPSANGFPPQVFHNDAFNPLLYHAHTNTFGYENPANYHTDTKQPTSTFSGDFKPLPMVHPFEDMGGAHGLSRYDIEDMPFGI